MVAHPVEKERVRPLFYFCAVGLFACLVLGGGAGSSFLSEIILQILCLPLIFAGLWMQLDRDALRLSRGPLLFCAAVVILALLELVPLPAIIWTHLPGREPAVSALKLIGGESTWQSVSLTPDRSWLVALSLIPALSVFLCALALGAKERRFLTLVALAGAVLNALIGLAQISGGPDSSLRFYEGTSTEAVGFFANRDHFAALLYASVPFVGAWVLSLSHDSLRRKPSETQLNAFMVLMLGTCVSIILLIAEVMARSRAGIALTFVALVGAALLLWRERRSAGIMSGAGLVVAVIGAIASLLISDFAISRLASRFGGSLHVLERVALAGKTITAGLTVAPLGAGTGAFVPLFAMFERPRDLTANVYVNHAHNDLVEIWAETGVIGLFLVVVMFVWIFRRSIDVWRQHIEEGVAPIDVLLPRAATISIALLYVHSLFDFPLRTSANLSIFAVACALLTAPPGWGQVEAADLPTSAPFETKRASRMGRVS
ncbi:O-antigen ligase family protein [Methylocystis hirsuta]|uniref:O-antigen ligase domain-containing protein n=1 Tax=Methylocystis hirsuta TaxID=369798 RepID=A0A3M9XKW9_9HYPH|nr:O-antigen ligase family protein [Methylocystis hirsuta]RNJ48694.1 O-antigen ligase domain-containing protein [Methylocystis hirsuta]